MSTHRKHRGDRLRFVASPDQYEEAAERGKRKLAPLFALGAVVVAAGVAAATYNVFTTGKPKTGSEQIASLPPINGCVFSKATVGVRAKAGYGSEALVVIATKGIDVDSACLDEAARLVEQRYSSNGYFLPILGRTYQVPQEFITDLEAK